MEKFEDKFEMSDLLSPKYFILYFVVVIFLLFAGFMYFANKKMI